MLFSIIVPVYNVEKYIEECIDSVLNQTYSNLEIILVNDGSSDNSKEICIQYQKEYPEKIQVVNQKNQGPYLARIQGVRKAKGDIIVFLDADDCLKEDCLEQLSDKFQKENCDIIIFNASTERDYSKPFRKYNLKNNYVFENETKKILYEKIITSSEMNNLCTKAIKTDLFDTDCDLDKFEKIRHGEDLLQLLPVITKAEKIVLMDSVLYYYRQREGSLIHKFDDKRNHSLKAVHQELDKYIDIWNMNDCKKKHYTREIKGWIVSLRFLLNEKSRLAQKQYKKYLYEMSADPYFINAYEKMDKKELDMVSSVLATSLYRKKFWHLEVFEAIRKIIIWR